MIRKSIAAAILLTSIARSGNAQTWRTVTDGRWTSPANWDGTLPSNDGLADVTFSQIGDPLKLRGTTTMDVSWNVRTITWNATALDSGRAQINEPVSGNTTLTLQAGLTNASGGRVEIYPDIVLAAEQTWHDTGGTMVVYGSLSGPGRLIKTGQTTLTLDAISNSHSGGMTIAGGSLWVRTGEALGSAASTLALDGATLHFARTRNVITPYVIDVPQALEIGAGGAKIQTREGTTTLRGVIAGPGELELEFDRSLSDFTQSRYQLAGTNTYAGGTRLDGVTAIISGNGQSLGTGDVTLEADSLLVLGADSNLAPGSKIGLHPGSVLVPGSPSSSFASLIDRSRTTGGTLALPAGEFSSPLDLAALALGELFLGAAGDAVYSAATLGPGYDGIYRLGGGSRHAFATPTLTLAAGNVLTGSHALIVGPGASRNTDSMSGGKVILSTSNDFSGGTTLISGNLGIGNDGALGSGEITWKGGSITAEGGARRISNKVRLEGGNVFARGVTGDLDFDGNIDLSGITQRLGTQNSGLVTVNGTLANGGLLLGGGRWRFTAANTFSLGLTVADAALEVASDSSLGAQNSPLLLSFASLRLLDSFATTRPITIDSGGGHIFTDGKSLTVAETIAGNGTLTKRDAGTLILKGVGKDFRALTIYDGEVRFEDSGSTSIVETTVQTGATLAGNGSSGYSIIYAGAHLAPGTSVPGTFTFTGGLRLDPAAILEFDLGFTASDRILLTHGTLFKTAGGPVLIEVADAGGLQPGQTYTLIDWSAAQTSNVTTSDFLLTDSVIDGNFAIVGKTLRLNTVPEPSATALWALGCCIFGARRRRISGIS